MSFWIGASLQPGFRCSSSFNIGRKHFIGVTYYLKALRCCAEDSSVVYPRRFATTAASPLKAPPKVGSRNVPQPLRAGEYQTIEQSLARRSSPTLLYQSPPFKLFLLGYYLTGGFCFAYSVVNFRLHYLNPVPGMSEWVRYAFVGITLFVAIAGIFFLTRVRYTRSLGFDLTYAQLALRYDSQSRGSPFCVIAYWSTT